jgi:N-alpha-acetyltransferase 40
VRLSSSSIMLKKEQQQKLKKIEISRKNFLVQVMNEENGKRKNLLSDFPSFINFRKNGIEVEISFSFPENTDADCLKSLFQLTKENMESIYNQSAGFHWNDSQKRQELADDQNSFLIAKTNEGTLAGFVSFRCENSDDFFESIYIFELQIAAKYQRSGLGRHLMLIAELIARKGGFHKMMLTVLKLNVKAIDFYRQKLKYEIDASSPSNYGEDSSYEILSKVVDAAKYAQRRALLVDLGL